MISAPDMPKIFYVPLVRTIIPVYQYPASTYVRTSTLQPEPDKIANVTIWISTREELVRH